MLALNRTKIDYFSLDVEGYELPILRTIPFDKLDISVLTVEYNHNSGNIEQGDTDREQFMKTKGFELHSKIDKNVPSINLWAHDHVYVNKGLNV